MPARNLEVCLTPAVFNRFDHKEAVVVIIDVLRASSAICTAFANGAVSIIPVSEVSEALEYKKKGFMVAAERDGFVLDFADLGNSPFNFTRDKVEGKTIVYSTTNGTRIIELASASFSSAIGTFNNLSAVMRWVLKQDHDAILFCAGWKDKFNLEDTICAGAMADILMSSGNYNTICDSTFASIDLWKIASTDPLKYIQKAAQRSRLRDKGLDDCIEYCMSIDVNQSVPVVMNGHLRDISRFI